ncbi:MAG: DUF732 domain-containing protein [Mycobacterium sp.]|uniref:DUF732 domain-containing protein n=1 Tax=Mycobacterium sp. TaxID=1785 RepID=UPI003BB682E2
MSTQTQAAAPDAGEPTLVVADDKATALAALAWSDAEDYPDDETELFDDADDRTTFWLRLYVAIVAAVVVVLGVTLGWVLSEHREPVAAVAVPTSSAPIATAPVPSGPDDSVMPSTTEPAPTPPPVIAEPPPVTTEVPPPPPVPVNPDADADRLFIEMLHGYGITTTQGSAAEIKAAHAACRLFNSGESFDSIAAEMVRENPAMTRDAALFVVDTAVKVYCPAQVGY